MPHSSPPLRIRRAALRDLSSLGRLGASLVRIHHEFDPRRFFPPGSNPERGYANFLATQLRERGAVLLVAEFEGEVAGYLFGAIEPRSWKDLRDKCGYVHDLVVDERSRGSGIGTALLEAAVSWFAKRGIRQVTLSTASGNDAAQRLFRKAGFRPTMVEMTRDID
jgi:ribosomal protein S18 acetylase RimI-like enzyme